MNVIKTSDGLLTNIEVAAILSERKAARSQRTDVTFEFNHFTNAENEVIKYFNSTSASQFSMEDMKGKLQKVKDECAGIHLTEGELVQLANHCPTQPVEIHMIIEECAERLDDSKVEVIADTFAGGQV